MKLKLKQTIKKALLCVTLAVAMLVSCNAGVAFQLSNVLKTSKASAVYKAENYHSYNFDSNSYFNNNTSGNSSNYTINRYQNLVDLRLDNNRYPIVKYNGITTLSSERAKDDFDMTKNNGVDDYAAVLSTNNYQVARKYYLTTTDGKNKFVTIKGNDQDVNRIYVSQIKKSGESDADYNARTTKLANAIASLNQKVRFDKYVCIDKTLDYYDSNDYTIIGTETAEYSQIAEDLKGQQIEGNAGEYADIVQNQYNFYYKKEFEYRENYLYFRTTSTTSLTNNSYYVLSCWVYTAGDATATIAISGTNLDAKIDDIKTDGVWKQYYLFIESRAAVSTSVYIYLYYGDADGVTGKDKSLTTNDYKGTNLSNGEENYKEKTMSGTVIFDNLKLTTINQADYVSQTINGYTPNQIALANLADGYTTDKIVNSSLATITGEGDNKTTTYTPAKYTSNADLSEQYIYTARYYSKNMFGSSTTPNDLDNGFNGSANINASDLVIDPNSLTPSSKLDYDSYLKLGASDMLTYYMPRYTDDKGSTELTSLDKEAYRQKYNNNMLEVSIVPESEFGEYERDELDELGNVKTQKDTDGTTSNKKQTITNNTFINAVGQTNYVLKLNNKNSAYDLGVTTNSFTIAPMTHYRVSVWAYSNTQDAVATAKLFSTLKTKEALSLGKLIISSQTVTDFEYNSNSTNGWKELVFFVQGNPYQSATLNLSLIASADDIVYFDNITIEAVSSSSYSGATYKLNLADTAVLTSNISNGLFNAYTTSGEDATNTYPYTASNWTKDADNSSEVISGIISTNSTEYNKVVPAYKDGKLYYFEEGDTGDYITDYAGKKIHTTTVKQMFGDQPVPSTTIYGQDLVPGNVYAVYLPQVAEGKDKHSFLIKSSNIGSSNTSTTLSANSVYKITFQAWLGNNFTGKIVAKLLFNNDPLTDIIINVDADSTIKPLTWQTFTMYVRTGNTSRSSISLQLGATESEGTIFFQNVNNTALAEKTVNGKKLSVDDQFDALVSANPTSSDQNIVDSNGMSNIVRFVDMQNNNFTAHSTKLNTETGVYDSYSYTLADKEKDAKYTQGIVGVVDTTNSFVYQENTITNIANPSDKTVTNTMLLLKNEKDTDYTLATSKYNTSLSANKYYKVTFDVKTSDMGDNGLNVTVNGINEHFNNINTASVTTNNGWSTYTIYVRVGSSSISSFSLSFTLGKAKDSYKGWALVSNINITEIEEDVYNTDTTNDEIKNSSNVIIKSLYTATTTNEEDKTNTNNFSWTTFFLVFSSVLLVVALVIALVAVVIKKRSKKSNSANKNTDTPTTEGGIV